MASSSQFTMLLVSRSPACSIRDHAQEPSPAEAVARKMISTAVPDSGNTAACAAYELSSPPVARGLLTIAVGALLYLPISARRS